jgi:hypothetical protein
LGSIIIELDVVDRAALVALLKRAVAADPFPMSARTKLLRVVLAKLRPLRPPPPKQPENRAGFLMNKRR